MAKRSTSQHALAQRYARALFSVSGSSAQQKAIAEGLAMVAEVFSSSKQLSALVRNRAIAISELSAVAEAIAAKLSVKKEVANLVKALASNRRLSALSNVSVAYAGLLQEEGGEVNVTVSTAQELSASDVKELTKRLTDSLQKKAVVATVVEPELLGGVMVQVGSKRVDASVKGRLDALAQKLKQTNLVA